MNWNSPPRCAGAWSAAAAAAEKCDVLVVVVPEGQSHGQDAVSRLVATALESGHFEAKPGKLLQAWRAEGVAAARVVLAGIDAAVWQGMAPGP